MTPQGNTLPRLPRRLRAHAAAILALPRHALSQPILEVRRDDYHEVRIFLLPVDLPVDPPEADLPGKWFSQVEQNIWNALAHGPVRGRQIAQAIGEEYGGRLRMLLSNLVDRGCLIPGRKGYSRAPSSPPGFPKSQRPAP